MRVGIGVLTRVMGRLPGRQEVSEVTTVPRRSRPLAAATRRGSGVRLRAIRRVLGRHPVATVTCLFASFILFRMVLFYALAAKAGVSP